MKQRGKQSAAAASVHLMPGSRAEPPSDLSKTQAVLWRQITATKPPSWFAEDSYPLLKQYCRVIDTVDQLEKMIIIATEIEPTHTGIILLARLLKLRDNETRVMMRLATAMRLTQQSRLKAETAATQSDLSGSADKPWALAT